MIDFWCRDTINTGEFDGEEILKSLPIKITKAIIRFRSHEDMHFKLVNELIIKK